nr:GGDEF domain-containing protein [Shewanella sp. NIFS-20-20]
MQKKNLYLLATTDELTGAKNRKEMYHQLAQARTQWIEQQVLSSIILLDLDHFKQLNDEFGHLFGDKVLRLFAQHILANLDSHETLYRYGGEEFLIVLQGQNQFQANVRANQLKTSMHQACLLNLHQSITCSMGVGSLAGDEDCDTWIKGCDYALYQAKKNGRNCVINREQQVMA